MDWYIYDYCDLFVIRQNLTSEVLNCYVKGLKPESKAFIQMQGMNNLNLAILLAKYFDSTFL